MFQISSAPGFKFDLLAGAKFGSDGQLPPDRITLTNDNSKVGDSIPDIWKGVNASGVFLSKDAFEVVGSVLTDGEWTEVVCPQIDPLWLFIPKSYSGVDLEASIYVSFRSSGRAMEVLKPVFIDPSAKRDPLFRVLDTWQFFCDDTFKDLVQRSELKGLEFASV